VWVAVAVAGGVRLSYGADAPTSASAFQAECAAKADAAQKANSMAVAGKDGWLFLGTELHHLGVGEFRGDAAANADGADPVPAILDFQQQLDRAGIQLLLVPVPPKAVVYPDKVGDAVPGPDAVRRDPFHQEFYRRLREKGVKVLDLTDEFIQARQHDAPDRRVYCQTDTHWSPSACELAARAIKAACRDVLPLPARPNPFRAETQTIEITGDLARALQGDNGAKEVFQLSAVTASGQDPKVSDTVDKASPVLLLGDSHGLIFHAGGDMLAMNAGLADQLAFELGTPVDLLAVRGSGATPARVNLLYRTKRDPQYLAGKKIVIWCFSAREFTENTDWRKVPVVRTESQ